MVLFLKNTIKPSFEKMILGISAGVMIAASVWSLLIPSINLATEQGKIAWLMPTLGFLSGIIVLIYIDFVLSKLKIYIKDIEKTDDICKKVKMLILAVTLHNIPEGMAVGVAFAGVINGKVGITLASATALSIGIAIQNFPEGAIVSVPLLGEGLPKNRTFLYGVLSGIVEPIGAIFIICASRLLIPTMPYLLSFAAGAMIYVVVEELIPEMSEGKHSNIGTLSFAVGFILMLSLDVGLG